MNASHRVPLDCWMHHQLNSALKQIMHLNQPERRRLLFLSLILEEQELK